MKCHSHKKSAGHIVGHVFSFLAVLALSIAVVMWLWNALIPQIFGGSTLTYWQAAGLIILAKLLFGGLGHHWHGHGHRHRGKRCGKERLSKKDREELWEMHTYLHNMSREERREFIRTHMHLFGGQEKPEQETDNETDPVS